MQLFQDIFKSTIWHKYSVCAKHNEIKHLGGDGQEGPEAFQCPGLRDIWRQFLRVEQSRGDGQVVVVVGAGDDLFESHSFALGRAANLSKASDGCLNVVVLGTIITPITYT